MATVRELVYEVPDDFALSRFCGTDREALLQAIASRDLPNVLPPTMVMYHRLVHLLGEMGFSRAICSVITHGNGELNECDLAGMYLVHVLVPVVCGKGAVT
jgi:hypothetical protein